MSKPDERLVEGVDEPCGEGMCQCRCGGGCVCSCECPGDPDEWQPGQCDGCYGGPGCACEGGQGAECAEDCRCGPPDDEPPSAAAVALARKLGEAGL